MLTVQSVARWPRVDPDPAGTDPAPPPVPGFIASTFAALVVEVSNRCLSRRYGAPPVDPAQGERTAVVLVSALGDQGTATAVAEAVDRGARLSPLLFFQSVPNSAAGTVAARWGLTGPVLCTSPAGDPMADAVATAELLVCAGDADQVLLVLVEQAGTGDRPDQAVAVLLGTRNGAPPTTDPTTHQAEQVHPDRGATR